MAKIYASLNAKGGPGKTTVACNMAIYFQVVKGLDVLIVDADDDDQDSAGFWMGNRDEDLRIPVIQLSDHNSLKKELPKLAAAYDVVVIDGVPGSTKDRMLINASILKVADVVIIPVEPAPLDVDRVVTTLDLVAMAQEVRGGPPATVGLLNGIDKRSNFQFLAKKSLEAMGLKVLETMLPALQEIRSAPGFGAGIVENKGAARDQFMAIMQEVEAL